MTNQIDHPPHYNAGKIEVIDAIEGDGYRMQTGKSSVYLLPGQLKMAD